jgi:hypothetical protein
VQERHLAAGEFDWLMLASTMRAKRICSLASISPSTRSELRCCIRHCVLMLVYAHASVHKDMTICAIALCICIFYSDLIMDVTPTHPLINLLGLDYANAELSHLFGGSQRYR